MPLREHVGETRTLKQQHEAAEPIQAVMPNGPAEAGAAIAELAEAIATGRGLAVAQEAALRIFKNAKAVKQALINFSSSSKAPLVETATESVNRLRFGEPASEEAQAAVRSKRPPGIKGGHIDQPSYPPGKPKPKPTGGRWYKEVRREANLPKEVSPGGTRYYGPDEPDFGTGRAEAEAQAQQRLKKLHGQDLRHASRKAKQLAEPPSESTIRRDIERTNKLRAQKARDEASIKEQIRRAEAIDRSSKAKLSQRARERMNANIMYEQANMAERLGGRISGKTPTAEQFGIDIEPTEGDYLGPDVREQVPTPRQMRKRTA